MELAIKGFRTKTAGAIRYFVQNYGLDFFVNEEDEAENILYNLFKSFTLQKPNEKIYIIIDEYDHLANELLGFHIEKFNPASDFQDSEFVSMLFYLGYLTISDEEIDFTRLVIPNKVMKELYSQYF